jgi:acetyltransferase-like isoleucine patch superfamily enzyme/dTDP-4-dehydrorhamnose 3,5-epimerase-like enzyme
MSAFIHPQALCESANIGEGTRVWAFAHVLPGAVVGRDCNLCDGVFVENDVVVGDRVTVKCGVQLWDGVRLGDDVFVGPNATFTNDPFPRSRQRPAEFAHTVVEAGASIGANATLLPGIHVGRHAMIGAGAVVLRDVPAYAIVAGNPAVIIGYVGGDSANKNAAPTGSAAEKNPFAHLLLTLPRFADMRGSLVATEFARDLPFVPQRSFVVFDVPNKEVRGEHAHRKCHQLLVCVSGSVAVMVDDGRARSEFVLERPDQGLHVPPMHWARQYRYSQGAALLVFASDPYDADDYIRSYEEFVRQRTAA